MTDEQIAQSCAEKVMGWHHGAGVEGWFSTPSMFRHWRGTWHPAIDILQAMEVQSEMRARGYWLRLQSPLEGSKVWAAQFLPFDRSRPYPAASNGHTHAEAICLAAILAVEHDAP